MARRFVSSRREFLQRYGVPRELGMLDTGAPETATSAPQPSGPRQRSTTSLVRSYLAYTRGERLPLAVAVLLLTTASCLALIPPASTKFVVDYVFAAKPLPEPWASRLMLPHDRWILLLLVTAVVFLASLLRTVLKTWGRWYIARSAIRIQLAFRKRVFEHTVRLPLVRVQELKSGGVASILHQDAGCLGDLTNAIFLDPWRAAVQLTGSLCVLAWVDWRMLLGTVVLLPGVYIMHRTWANRIRPQYREIHGQRQKINAHVVEAFGGMRVVRAFGRERSETARYLHSNHLMARQHVRVWWWSTFIQIVWGALLPLGIASLLLYGGWQVIHANLSVGALMMFLAFIMMLLEPISALAQSATQLQTSFSSLDRVLDLLETPREMLHVPHAVIVRKADVRGRLTLEDVTFCYPEQTRSALQQIQLDVLAGQTIALVGRSGAGKTTLCNLVARFYDPTQGRVLLDGQDLRNIDVESYRNLLGVVEQEVFLFDGTVADNISYAKRNAPGEEIRTAATIAHADEFIRELPDGYETIIGERGVKLSGGQRQRLAIARAVLADPRILILDEATSNLDTMSERYIQESLGELMRNRTCFVIAHRLSTIAHADQVVVLDGGRIVEKGTQEELMEADSKYREMVYAQVGQVSPLFSRR